MTGSAIFMFVLGLGTTYSRRTNRQMVQSGVKMLIYELVWNVLAMGLPTVLGQLLRGMFGLETAWDFTWEQMPILLQYINVFFIAGISYFLLAFLRWVGTPVWVYFALTLLFIFVNPFLYMEGKSTGFAVADYVLTMFAGGRPEVSLICLAHFPYVLLGAGFGRLLRKTADKTRLYKTIAIPAAAIVVVYFLRTFRTYEGLDALYQYSSDGYVYPDTLRALANCCCVLLMAGALYGLRNWIAKQKLLHRLLIHLNKETTPYYAIHPFFYGLCSSLALYVPFSAMACVVLTPVVWVLCFAVIIVWKRLQERWGGRCRMTAT